MTVPLTVLRLSLYVLPATSFWIAPFLVPFYEPQSQDTFISANTSFPLPELRKRGDNCPIDHFSCSKLAAAYGGACCASGFECTTDGARQIACCTMGAKCTGTLARPTVTSTGDPALDSSAIIVTSSTTNVDMGPTVTSSVNNIYFPFPYSPTTFSDKDECLSAFYDCKNNYAACTASLQGTNYGVTIVAPAGGITVAPTAQPLDVSSASKICSSLSSQACHGIERSDCENLVTSFAFATVANALARPTMGPLATAGMVAGVGWEVVRQMI
ncbi:hypothetical protein GcM3_054008 [Golovinomyces cichoracearum]|uniref:Gpi-anchored protein n=1 Tax=Golovinomyces cichoracearum TaxID=62708 RepID=A0A420IYF0_9PEZI|nr:hypothetical protein GcM3_054008 [Golovinomyces cichoracearum]